MSGSIRIRIRVVVCLCICGIRRSSSARNGVGVWIAVIVPKRNLLVQYLFPQQLSTVVFEDVLVVFLTSERKTDNGRDVQVLDKQKSK